MEKTVFEKMRNSNPEYSKYMYLDGYKPEEILSSLRQKMLSELVDDREDDGEEIEIRSIVEVKK